jgi:hypothetical protein
MGGRRSNASPLFLLPIPAALTPPATFIAAYRVTATIAANSLPAEYNLARNDDGLRGGRG